MSFWSDISVVLYIVTRLQLCLPTVAIRIIFFFSKLNSVSDETVVSRSNEEKDTSSIRDSPVKKAKRRTARILEDSDDETEGESAKTNGHVTEEKIEDNKGVKENGVGEKHETSPQVNGHPKEDQKSPSSSSPPNEQVAIPKRKTGNKIIHFPV